MPTFSPFFSSLSLSLSLRPPLPMRNGAVYRRFVLYDRGSKYNFIGPIRDKYDRLYTYTRTYCT